MHHLVTAAVAFLAAFAALLAVLAVCRYLEPVDRGRRRRLEQRLAPIVFLFDHARLADATEPGRRLLARLPGTDLESLLGWLGPRLPNAAATLAALPDRGTVEAEGDRLHLRAEDLGEGMMRLTLSDSLAEGTGVVVDALSQNALEEEVELLRQAVDGAPLLCWREDGAGGIAWANAAYLAEAETRLPGHPAWPVPRLFDLPPDLAALEGGQRQSLGDGAAQRWFMCHARADAEGGGRLVFALPADEAVHAERSLREFVQTLAKTFADLPIGLAVFDRGRNLQLFNPALIDLTGLPTTFLAARPSLYALLDRLREARMVPEPKDYRSWQRQMSTLEAAAASGHHVETWSLPGGRTYRVTGRPHPDGALAFLFEDITSEMSMTRRFRAQLSVGTQVVDTLDEALAVFGSDGQMLLGNEAWRRVWDDDVLPLPERLRAIGGAGGGGPGAQRLAELLAPGAAREGANGAMAATDGTLLAWRILPLPGGQWMLGFTPNPARVQPAAMAGEALRRSTG
ncbi:PAS domain-containing protein [Paracoccus sp. S-4012]|uniref:PAS-domain containing protein n=1 Tax=Paracoccus sp. S-4012 TaxID=2665648 RepID=UPI0012B1052D|nr:PAS-domain containing protein [Paracoccus sp. S-4012]MRX49821.1 PAS domain-containing protein [Paracoccus sp. S-4012]